MKNTKSFSLLSLLLSISLFGNSGLAAGTGPATTTQSVTQQEADFWAQERAYDLIFLDSTDVFLTTNQDVVKLVFRDPAGSVYKTYSLNRTSLAIDWTDRLDADDGSVTFNKGTAKPAAQGKYVEALSEYRRLMPMFLKGFGDYTIGDETNSTPYPELKFAVNFIENAHCKTSGKCASTSAAH